MRPKYKFNIYLYDEHIDSNGKIKASAIEFNKVEEQWLYNKNGWQVEAEDLEKIGLPVVESDQEIDLQDKKIYRFPKITLPRQKMDLIKDKYNCKVIRDITKADICIVSLKLFDTLLERTWASSIPYQSLFQVVKWMKADKDAFTDLATAKIQEFLNETPTFSMIDFKVNKHWNGSSPKLYDEVNKYMIDEDLSNDEGNDWILPKKSAEAFNNLMQSTSQIVFDTDISNIIDSELAVIGNDKYEDIRKMIESTDIDNRSLAVEMMANCNIEKSFDVVSGLYYWKYEWFKSTNNWNSVNVKAMRNRLKAYEGVHNTNTIYSFNNYLSLLAKDRKLTRFAVDKSRKQLLNTLLGPIVGDSSDIFKVDLDNLYIVDKIEENVNE
jgi:hypothetical protein